MPIPMFQADEKRSQLTTHQWEWLKTCTFSNSISEENVCFFGHPHKKDSASRKSISSCPKL